MSASNGNRDSDVKKAYVREMLELNPMWQSGEIIRRRREILDGNPAQRVPVASAATRDPARPLVTTPSLPRNELADHPLRDRARRSIETLETTFFQLTDEKLRQHLSNIDSDRLPEYAAKVKQLRRVAEHREVLIEARSETQDDKFSYSLLNSLVGPPSDAGSLREQYIEAIIDERRVVPACKMIRRYVKNHPDIYALERDWFDLLIDPKNEREWSSRYSFRSRYKRFARNPVINIAAIVIFCVVAVLAETVDHDEKGRTRNSNRARPTTSSRPDVPNVPAPPDPAQSDPAQSDPAYSDPAYSDPAYSDPTHNVDGRPMTATTDQAAGNHATVSTDSQPRSYQLYSAEPVDPSDETDSLPPDAAEKTMKRERQRSAERLRSAAETLPADGYRSFKSGSDILERMRSATERAKERRQAFLKDIEDIRGQAPASNGSMRSPRPNFEASQIYGDL